MVPAWFWDLWRVAGYPIELLDRVLALLFASDIKDFIFAGVDVFRDLAHTRSRESLRENVGEAGY